MLSPIGAMAWIILSCISGPNMATVNYRPTPKGGLAVSGSTLEGTEELIQLLSRFDGQARATAKRTLYTVANPIMTEAKKITPVYTGNLRGSGQVQQPEERGDTISVTLGFGNTAVKYAIFVHEKLNARHKAPTQAKFLERPLLEAASTIEGRMAVEIRKDLEAVAKR